MHRITAEILQSAPHVMHYEQTISTGEYMRALPVVAFLLISPAYACPQLAGRYVCRSEAGKDEIIDVKQTTANQVLVYSFNGKETRADNRIEQLPDEPNLRNATSQAWCDDGLTLKVKVVGNYRVVSVEDMDLRRRFRDIHHPNNLQTHEFGDITINVSFSKVGENLKQSRSGEMISYFDTFPVGTVGQNRSPFTGETTCTKAP